MSRERGHGRYNVVVIGGGTAGLVCAAGTAGLGGRVALVERHLMGGDCLNTGCVPSKALLASARRAFEMRHADRWGLAPASPPPDLAAVLARITERRARLAPHDSTERFESLGVDVFHGPARFVSPHEVEVEGIRLRAVNFVIATGGRPRLPEVPGLAAVAPLTNETVFERLPAGTRRLIVIGGGPIGCELGQAFARLGVNVVLLQTAGQILEREDEDAAACIRRALEAEGLRVVTGARLQQVRRVDGEIRVDLESGGTLAGDAVLVATGRAPNTEDLALATAGIALEGRALRVNEHLQTSQPHIYAAGDVIGGLQFTHLAEHHARVIVRNILFPWKKTRVDTRALPWCTFTSPEVARVGLNETQARERGIAYDMLVEPIAAVDRAVLESEEEGFAKVLLEKGRDRILGATVVAAHAGEILSELVLAMKTGVGLRAIAGTIHAYPTFAEVSRRLADQHQRRRLTPRAQGLLRALYRWRRGPDA